MSKVKRSLTLREMYKCYCIQSKLKGIKPKPFADWKKIIVAMGQTMSDILLEDGIIGLPWNNGDIFLKRIKRDMFIDHQESRKQKKKVYKFNDHSDGICYITYWLSPERMSKKLSMWWFSLYRETNRELARLVIDEKKVYPDFKMMHSRTIK